jgi:tetratricopeptide (TPR) repeat protein
MAARNERFGRLLRAGISSIVNVEGKTAPIVEDELGSQIGVAAHTIQRYKTGYVPPETRSVQLLAEACVRRGHMNREWLQRFLQSAHFPAAEQLIEELYPNPEGRARPERAYHNLPAPTYNQFVMRLQVFDAVLDGLRQRSAVVLVASLGGMGKTSLAREVAERCLKRDPDLPQVDAVVWLSDKDRPGTTNLSVVLNEIVRTLDFPGLAQLSFAEKLHEVEQLLRRQMVLVVIDNFETITDDALLHWLLRLPEPSKAIITTRTYRRELRSSWPIDLAGMRPEEARQLIAERLRALKIERLVEDISQLDPLIAVTGGNPKAIELAIGMLKFERRPLAQIIHELETAQGELFTDLFERSWAMLDVVAQETLMALTMFLSSASHEALAATVGAPEADFEQAVDLLADLALVDVQHVNLQSFPRYALHPLVRAFGRSKFDERSERALAMRERWLHWYGDLADRVGFRWDDLKQLALLDSEHETMHAAIEWCYEHGRYAETIRLIEGVRYYYNVRGLWDDRLSINLIRADAARKIGDRCNEALALAHHIEIRSKQGALDEAAHYREQLLELAETPDLPDDTVFEIQHALALYARARKDWPMAERIWRDLLELSGRLGGQKSVINRRWLAACVYQRGDLEGAQALYRESLEDAVRCGDQRSVIGNSLKLAAIEMEQGNLEQAAQTLAACRPVAEELQDRRRLGELHVLTARLARLQGDVALARSELGLAVDLFERLGMRGELAETQRALDALG